MPVLALLCAGCSGADGAADVRPSTASAATASSPVPGIEAEVVRHRTDVPVAGRVHVRVTATGDQPFTVTAVAIDSPDFAPLPPTVLTAAFEPGRTIDLRTAFGAPDCSAQRGPVAARLTVARPDGAVEELRVPLGGDDLETVHRQECAVAGVLAVAGIASPAWPRRGTRSPAPSSSPGLGTTTSPYRGRRSAQRRPGPRRGGAAAPARARGAAGDGGRGVHRGVLRAARAGRDQAAVRLPVSVAVGDADPVPVPLPVDAAQQAVLQDLLNRAC